MKFDVLKGEMRFKAEDNEICFELVGVFDADASEDEVIDEFSELFGAMLIASEQVKKDFKERKKN